MVRRTSFGTSPKRKHQQVQPTGGTRWKKANKGENSRDKKSTCIVCSSAIPKYKCPNCREPYCSVACCKAHKETCSPNLTTAAAAATTNKINTDFQRSKYYLPPSSREDDDSLLRPTKCSKRPFSMEEQEEEELWHITEDMKQTLNNSQWLRKELSDGGLRQLITEIDSSGISSIERSEALHDAICKNSNFRGFVDQLLVTTGVIVKEEDDRLVLVHPGRKKQNEKQLVVNALTNNDVNESDACESVDFASSEEESEEENETSDESSSSAT